MKKSAFIFPGQGSQYSGMGLEFFTNFKEAENIFVEADGVLGYSLSKICFVGRDEELGRTEITQTAILAASIAALEVLKKETGIIPIAVAGHSLGEYTALVCAGSLSFTEALKLVRKRGIYMQNAVPEGQGAMVAVLGLEKDILAEVCKAASVDGIVVCANYNSPSQTVISGETAGVEKAMKLALGKRAKKAIRLPVSIPSHSPLMKEAADKLLIELNNAEISDIKRDNGISFINNVDAAVLYDKDKIKASLYRQLFSSVLWVDVIEKMIEKGTERFIEIGPKRVLSGLVKDIAKNKGAEVDIFNVEDIKSLEKLKNSLNT